MKADGNDYYYAHDHLYSPIGLIDSSGTVLERYEYDAYGNCNILEPNFAPDPDGKSDYGNPYLFTGRRLDILNFCSLKRWFFFPGVVPENPIQQRGSPKRILSRLGVQIDTTTTIPAAGRHKTYWATQMSTTSY